MSLAVLKAIEQRLIERGLVAKPASCYPLWAVAEMERNLYLWRRGRSVRDHGGFTFWVDIAELIAKRIADVAAESGLLPESVDESLSQERRYLLQLSQLLLKIGAHAHALSRVEFIVEKEVGLSGKSRTTVILPHAN